MNKLIFPVRVISKSEQFLRLLTIKMWSGKRVLRYEYCVNVHLMWRWDNECASAVMARSKL